jgi:hypothetical protein
MSDSPAKQAQDPQVQEVSGTAHVNSPLMEFGNLIILLKVGEPKGTM